MFLSLLETAAIATEPVTRSSAVDFSFLFLKMIAALVVAVTLAILVLKYAVPRLSFARKLSDDQRIKILSRVSLGAKQHLYLVKAAEKCILLGVTDHTVTKITDVEEPRETK
jgi:flagellar biosynthetic protein FliO